MHCVAVALCVAGFAWPAAAETTKNFTVGAVIGNGCAVATSGSGGSWGSIDLGTVTGIAAQTATGSLVSNGLSGLQLDCTPGLTVSVTADQGQQASGGVRQLANASATSAIPYALYANGGLTPWTTQAVSLSFASGMSHQSLPIKAIATLSGPTRAGVYADTVQVTVTW